MTQQLPPGSFTAPYPADSCHMQDDAPVERVGECDLCGSIDHHLVLGICEECQHRYHPKAHGC